MYTFGTGRRTVSWLYKAILTHSGRSLDRLRQTWEEASERAYNDKEWSRALEYPWKVLRNSKFK